MISLAIGLAVLGAMAFQASQQVTPRAQNAVFDIRDFGAVGDGRTDDTAAIQKALDRAAEKGGEVFVPAGKWLVAGSLKIPVGVTLSGVAKSPQAIAPLIGTVIYGTRGRDSEDGPALFEMGHSSCVRGLTVFYPDQKPDDIRPYPWTFHLVGFDNTVENVTLINSYNGIKVGPEPNVRHRIRSVYGCVLRRGILVDACTDIGRIENIQFHCHWWSSPEIGGNWEKVHAFMIQNCEAFIFGRTDWEYVTNTFVYPVNIGYRFIQTPSGAMNGQLCGIGADEAQRCVVVEAIQPMGLLITNGQFVAFRGEDPIAIEIKKTANGSVRLVNCAFWGPSNQNVVSHGVGFLSLSDCYFSSGKPNHPGRPLIEADAGRLQIRGCSFATSEPSIHLKPGVLHAIIVDNNGFITIKNEIGDRAVIRDNEQAPK